MHNVNRWRLKGRLGMRHCCLQLRLLDVLRVSHVVLELVLYVCVLCGARAQQERMITAVPPLAAQPARSASLLPVGMGRAPFGLFLPQVGHGTETVTTRSTESSKGPADWRGATRGPRPASVRGRHRREQARRVRQEVQGSRGDCSELYCRLEGCPGVADRDSGDLCSS